MTMRREAKLATAEQVLAHEGCWPGFGDTFCIEHGRLRSGCCRTGISIERCTPIANCTWA
eukprot:13621450-Alexandrium_andersonii.AAC.1